MENAKNYEENFAIAVCDDEKNIRDLFREVLEDEGYNVVSAKNSDELFKLISLYDIKIIFLDIILENENGIDVLEKIKKEFPDIEIIIISGHGTIDLAVKATKLGAFDFLSKPVTIDYIIQAVKKIMYVKKLKEENIKLKARTLLEDDFVGESEEIKKIKKMIKIVAQSDSKVLITGENGTGKELVARLIHLYSPRKNNEFVEINCAAIPSTLIEAELFGFEKGSFTNAVKTKIGKFEIADGGTLFLDEIGDMGLDTQVKVLRVIQDGRFTRIGGVNTIEVNVRIISATNKNLEEEIKKNRFREDLYYRLNVIPIHLPALRERREDIPLLIKYFINKIKSTGNLRFKDFTQDAYNFFKNYDWPGNIRELKNIIERVNILSTSEYVDIKDLERIIINVEKNRYYDIENKPLRNLKEEFEKNIIEKRLKQFDYNITKTAQSLQIERTNLYKKIKKYNIDINKK